MTARGARRAARRGRSGGPAPELVAAVLVVVLYVAAVVVGMPRIPSLPGIGGTKPSDAAIATSAPTPGTATPDPMRADVTAILEIDRRLLEYRASLQQVLSASPFRSAEAASVLRRVASTVTLGQGRASALSLDPRTQGIGSQLELIYASAAATAAGALDLAISSNAAYRAAAQEIVDLFADLPSIDVALLAAIGPVVAPSPGASAGSAPSAPASAEPTTGPSVEPSPGGSAVASGSPLPTRSPGEMLRNPGFDLGMTPWTLVQRSADDQATTRPDLPIVATGTASLRVDITSISATPDGIQIGQGDLGIEANTRYAVRVVVQSTVERSARLRVVGPNQATYGVRVATVGPTPSTVSFEFIAIADDPAAALWIDIAGPLTGAVWLDEASFAPITPG